MKTNSMLHPFADVQNQLQKKRQQLMLKRGYLELAKNAAIILIIVLIAFTQVFYITVSSGTDMYPAIRDVRSMPEDNRNDTIYCSPEGISPDRPDCLSICQD